MAHVTKAKSRNTDKNEIEIGKRRRSDRSSAGTESELSPKRTQELHDQHNTHTQSTSITSQNVTLGSTGEMIAGSNEILNARPELAMIHQTPNQMTNTQVPEGAPIHSPNLQQHPHFGVPSGFPQFQAPVPTVQNILVDIHNKFSKLNCLDEILNKLGNLETRFAHMEQTVNYLT